MNRSAIRDQENLVHTQQTVLAAKQLNQNPRSLSAKAPINKHPKTPVRVPLNNENAPFRTGKSGLRIVGKGNENTTSKGFGKGDLEKKQPYTPKGIHASSIHSSKSNPKYT